LKSGGAVAEYLQKDVYDVHFFSISKTGVWNSHENFPDLNSIPSKESTSILSEEILRLLLNIDVLFPVLHGPFGEDGIIQGFFEMLNKPYVGCDHRSSAISMDKAMTKIICQSLGVNTSPYRYYFKSDWIDDCEKIYSEIIKTLKFPVFVKATHLGSAIGVVKVENPYSLKDSIHKVFQFDDKIIVEQEIKGREIEFAVLGNAKAHVFPPGEVFSNGDVYTYDAKYGSGGFNTSPRAKLSKEEVGLGRSLAYDCYKAIGCEGMARVDFFLDDRGEYWLNEINPIPGFTSISLFPKVCIENGLSFSGILNRLIILAMHRFRKKGYEKKNK